MTERIVLARTRAAQVYIQLVFKLGHERIGIERDGLTACDGYGIERVFHFVGAVHDLNVDTERGGERVGVSVNIAVGDRNFDRSASVITHDRRDNKPLVKVVFIVLILGSKPRILARAQ